MKKFIAINPLIILNFILLVFANSCSKDEKIKDKLTVGSLLKDSLFFYAKDVYLWGDQLPSKNDFFKNNFLIGDTEEDILKNEIFSIAKYATNPITQKSYEFTESQPRVLKYSKIVTRSNNFQSEKNFGLSLVSSNNNLFIQYVVPGSPADNELLKRGDKILKINSQDVPVTIKNIDFFLTSDRLELRVQRKDRVFDVLLFQDSYNMFPINHTSLLNAKTGYISLLQFYNINVEQLRSKINELGDVDNLIVDLRYNGGGYVNLVEEFANLIIPYSFNKSIMRKERYNVTMQSSKAFSLKNQFLTKEDGSPIFVNNSPATLFDIDYSMDANTYLFDKKTGITDIKKIVFIVSDKTASASELLISIIKPYVETKIIGVSFSENAVVRTFGKPVGFFRLKLSKYDLYLSMFQNLNKNNEGDYYEGIPADYSVLDNVNYDFGDVSDESLNTALSIFGSTNKKKNDNHSAQACNTPRF